MLQFTQYYLLNTAKCKVYNNLVTLKPGKSHVFPDEIPNEPKSNVVKKPTRKKILISRKKRKLAKKISDKSSDEFEDSQKTLMKYSKKTLKIM